MKDDKDGLIKKIDLVELIKDTRPNYWIKECFFGPYDCSRDFVPFSSLLGMCLWLDPNKFPGYKSFER